MNAHGRRAAQCETFPEEDTVDWQLRTLWQIK
jgi:hypothetical protein